MEIPRCNNVGTEWYGRIPANPPLVDPKGEKLHESLSENMPLWKHLTLGQIIGLHIEMARNVCWNKSYTVIVGQSQYQAGQPGKKRGHSTTLITQISFCSAVIQMLGNCLSR